MPLSVFERAEFLKKSGWSAAEGYCIGDDWSQRKYFRITKDGRHAILLHGIPDHDPRSIAGHKLESFINVAKYLRGLKLSVPEIYATDLGHGLILMEDLGSETIDILMSRGTAQEKDLYLLASSALKFLNVNALAPPLSLPNYFSSHIYIGKRRVLDWYIPARRQKRNPNEFEEGFASAWQEVEKNLPPPKLCFQHGDYHPGNLLYLPERTSLAKLGILDFQGALLGPSPYDLVNLLEDARKIVPPEAKFSAKNTFTTGFSLEEKESFELWYVVLSAHFHCRVIGQAISLAHKKNITRLMSLIPALEHYIVKDLAHTALKPLASWFHDAKIDFSQNANIDLSSLSNYVTEKAY